MPTKEFFILLLLLAANGTPLLVRMALGKRWRRPLDAGRVLADGRALFGPSKTLAGLVAALLASTLLALILGFGWSVGLLVGGFAMLGDLFSSFVKRRMGLRSSAMALGLDQVPESLFPLVVCAPLLDLSWTQVSLLTLAFLISELLLSRLAFHLGFRQHPY